MFAYLKQQHVILSLFFILTVGHAYPFARVYQDVLAQQCSCCHVKKKTCQVCRVQGHHVKKKSSSSQHQHHAHAHHIEKPSPTTQVAFSAVPCSSRPHDLLWHFHGDPHVLMIPLKIAPQFFQTQLLVSHSFATSVLFHHPKPPPQIFVSAV